jgi:Kef-type K+ transport system membrane component KefB
MATVTAHQLLILLIQLAALLLIATMLGSLATRLGMPAVVGELLTGVLLGPSILGHIAPKAMTALFPARPDQARLLDAVGQIGVILLVGITGAHLDVSFVRRSARAVGWVSGVGLIIPFALGVSAGLVLPHELIGPGADRTRFALLIGVALAVSALPVIAKTLADMNMLHRDIAQLILAAGTVDDTVAWLGLALVTARVTSTRLAYSLAALFGILVVSVVLRPAIHTLIGRARRWNEPSVPAFAVVIMLLGAAGTDALGFEPVFGAFVSGTMLFSGGRDPIPLEGLRSTVLSVFAPIFLASAGLRMDLSALRRPPVVAAALLVLLVAVVAKFGGAYLGARLGALDHWEGVALGAGLNTRGIVQVVVATTGLQLGLLTTEAYTVLVLIAIITSVMGPPLLRISFARIPFGSVELARKQVLALQPSQMAERGAL